MVRRAWAWLTNTSPFSALKVPADQACFTFEQISDTSFQIPEGRGFQYNPDDGSTADVIVVDRTTLPETDFASIPRYMSWFVSRHGRHTPAALVHDTLITDKTPFEDRKRADRLFLTLMDKCGVPPVQGRVMWAAATLATRWVGTAWSRAGVVVWGALAAAGIVLLGVGLATLDPLLLAIALVGPAVGSLCWGDQFRAGLIAGYALPVIAVPALVSALGYWVYWAIEMGVKLVTRHDRPGPIPYQGGERERRPGFAAETPGPVQR